MGISKQAGYCTYVTNTCNKTSTLLIKKKTETGTLYCKKHENNKTVRFLIGKQKGVTPDLKFCFFERKYSSANRVFQQAEIKGRGITVATNHLYSPKSLLLGNNLTWSNSARAKIGRLNKN